jgi:peptide deformylase
MAVMPLVLLPQAVLRQVAQPVDDITDDILQLANNMAETMYAAPGIGLAANQVGLLKRVIVMDCARDDEPPALWKMINPEIIWLSEENTKMEEGCLSIPGHNAEVVRPSEVHVSYLDIEGQKQEMQATGLLAACVQHEIDHLNGVLFLDHLSRLKRDMIMRKVIKENRTQND